MGKAVKRRRKEEVDEMGQEKAAEKGRQKRQKGKALLG